ncbi:MAG: Uncharacterised protein [Opitutia bacterium UBA7350]|nr:MAG: Uncharacterised protein [Opitutae bacterium UBA7350]
MKDSPSNDPIDTTIDTLLRVQPLDSPNDMTERVLAAVQKPSQAQQSQYNPSTPWKPLAYILSLAAALALSLSLWFSIQTPETKPELSLDQAQEIFRMEASLSAISPVLDDQFSAQGLLATLETANFTF